MKFSFEAASITVNFCLNVCQFFFVFEIQLNRLKHTLRNSIKYIEIH